MVAAIFMIVALLWFCFPLPCLEFGACQIGSVAWLLSIVCLD